MKKATFGWLLIFGLLLPTLLALAGTTGKIAGRVVDADTREPLPSVNVVVVGTTLGATTGADGQYFILSVPAGTYSLKASMLGYKEHLVRNVLVQTDLTTRLDFRLESTVLEAGEEVVVVAEKPLIEKDVTASRMTTTSQTLSRMPVDRMQDILILTAGAVDENGNLHIRGGRNREIAFLIDGAVVADPLSGAFDGDVPEMALEEVSVQTGGFGAEYGSAQSGIVNMVLKEGGPSLSGALRAKTSDFSGYRRDPWHEQLWNVEGSLGGPVPFIRNFRYYLTTEWSQSKGNYPNEYSEPLNISGKFTYNPIPKLKLALNGFYYANEFGDFFNEWKRTTFEDRNPDILKVNPAWYDNGQLDTEWIDYNQNGTYEQVWIDTNGDGVLENVEFNDLNNNGYLDTEDLNHNGALDSYSMLDHTPEYEARSDQMGFTLTHTLSERTFYEARLSRYRTYLKWNINENTNEDQDGDGRFDMGELRYHPDGQTYTWNDVNGDGIVQLSEDLNGNGQFDFELDSNHDGIPDIGQDLGLDGLPYTGDYGENDGLATTEDLDNDGRFDLDPEDLNGDGIWNFVAHGPDYDLYTDENHNGYADASEVGDMDNWIPMTELPMFGVGSKDDDGFFKYDVGNTYYRDRWHEDEKYVYNAQFHLTSQVNPHHQVKCGIEGSYYDIMSYDVDAASGGNIYGEDYKVYPHAFAVYAQDKMEFEGLIVNAGLRFDYFNANYDNYPTDIHDPVLDQTIGGEIKNPKSIPAKYAWSPRLGVSHPITDKDVLYFNYGRYFQVPRFDYMFENLTFQLTGAFPIIGNADLEPEQTTSYELGVKHQFANDLVLNVTGFFKDVTGLTNNRQIFYSASSWYGLYDNTDYGNVRGFEVTVIRPRHKYLSGTLTYTYSFARGKNSSPTADYVTVWAGDNVPTTETFLDWDQRHTIAANLDFRTMDQQTFWGVPYTQNLGFNFIFEYGSGLPWSPPSRDQDAWKVENTERLPYTLNVDMIADKGFHWRRFYTKFFLEVRNLLNKQNILRIADAERYMIEGDADGRLNDPTVFAPPRLMRVGLQVQF